MKTGAQSGHTLVLMLVAVAVVSTVVGTAVLTTTQTTRNAQRTRVRDEAIAVGDAYLEWAFAQWRSIAQTRRNSALPTSYFETLGTPPSSLIADPSRFTISNFTISALDADGKPMRGAVGAGKPGRDTPPAQVKSQGGEDDLSYYYLAQVDVTASAAGGPKITVKARRVFEKLMESPWKYAIAYLAADRPALELHPSPVFTVKGWVHGNGALYISPDGGKALNFLDKVTSVENYIQGYMKGDYEHRGKSPAANDPSYAPGAAATFFPGIPWSPETRKDAFGIIPTQFDPKDSNPNNDSYRELLEAPDDNFSDPLTDEDGNNPRFYNNAGVKVIIDKNNNLTIRNAAGTVVTASSKSADDRKLYNAIAAIITRNQTIQDNREGGTIRLITVDVSKIQTSQMPGWNGVLYVSDATAGQDGKSAKRGVRLKNGATLPNDGLTIVSDNPIYIQGNYNTSATRQPSAVIGDAVTILSNAWTDSNSSANLSSRIAADTTVNTAILSGIVPTDPSLAPSRTAYSGGVENFPRFLENWTGRTITYTGSMIQLFYSKQAIGRWGKDNVYDAPNRDWAFDTSFRTNPPPGTLFTTVYKKQRWYLE